MFKQLGGFMMRSLKFSVLAVFTARELASIIATYAYKLHSAHKSP